MSQFKGVFTAIVTPFRHGDVDYVSLRKLVEFQVKSGIHGIVVNGTTGESPTLEKNEVLRVYETVREIVGKDFPLLLGTGSNCTRKTIEASQMAEEIGANGVLVVTPYYNKPPQRGLVQHFTEVARSINIPVVLYNVPGRTITSLSPETVSELSKVRNIVGIKEASGDLELCKKIKSSVESSFLLTSGDDGTWLEFLLNGGNGTISVMSNIFPKQMVELYGSMKKSPSNYAQCAESFQEYKRFLELLYVEANPIPAKWALYLMNLLDSYELRLPLVHLDMKHQEPMRAELIKLGAVKR
jgi:4-hydroxy-tetrahydrodipicolinate synthase